jgi:hypothetical protein
MKKEKKTRDSNEEGRKSHPATPKIPLHTGLRNFL